MVSEPVPAALTIFINNLLVAFESGVPAGVIVDAVDFMAPRAVADAAVVTLTDVP